MKDPALLGQLVIGLGILIALITSLSNYVSKPINDLNRTIASLDARLKAMSEDVKDVELAVKEQEAHDRESHSRIWAKHNDHDHEIKRHHEKICDHEMRIGTLEKERKKL